MTTRRRLAVCLLVCGLIAQIAAGTGLGAAEPSPKPLWKLYPLDPTEGDARERPAITTTTSRPSPPPRSGVAGVSTGKRGSSDDDGTPVVLGLLLGGIAAAIFLLLMAVLPPRAVVRLRGLRADRRLDMVLAGVLALLVVTIVYLAGVS